MENPGEQVEKAKQLHEAQEAAKAAKNAPVDTAPDRNDIDSVLGFAPPSTLYEGPGEDAFTIDAAKKWDAAKGDTSVDTAAITAFANHMEQYVTELREKTVGLRVRNKVTAGSFPSAIELAGKVERVAEDLEASIAAMVEVFSEVKEKLAKVALDYKTLEEANKITATKLTEITGGMGQKVTNVGNVDGVGVVKS